MNNCEEVKNPGVNHQNKNEKNKIIPSDKNEIQLNSVLFKELFL